MHEIVVDVSDRYASLGTLIDGFQPTRAGWVAFLETNYRLPVEQTPFVDVFERDTDLPPYLLLGTLDSQGPFVLWQTKPTEPEHILAVPNVILLPKQRGQFDPHRDQFRREIAWLNMYWDASRENVLPVLFQTSRGLWTLHPVIRDDAMKDASELRQEFQQLLTNRNRRIRNGMEALEKHLAMKEIMYYLKTGEILSEA